MEVPVAKNFNEYVAVLVANSPHALVLDSWRRLDLALHDYASAIRPGVDPGSRRAIEEAVSQDEALGIGFAGRIRELRELRNRAAHESIYLSSEKATDYAREAFSLIAGLARRVSELERAA